MRDLLVGSELGVSVRGVQVSQSRKGCLLIMPFLAPMLCCQPPPAVCPDAATRKRVPSRDPLGAAPQSDGQGRSRHEMLRLLAFADHDAKIRPLVGSTPVAQPWSFSRASFSFTPGVRQIGWHSCTAKIASPTRSS